MCVRPVWVPFGLENLTVWTPLVVYIDVGEHYQSIACLCVRSCFSRVLSILNYQVLCDLWAGSTCIYHLMEIKQSLQLYL